MSLANCVRAEGNLRIARENLERVRSANYDTEQVEIDAVGDALAELEKAEYAYEGAVWQREYELQKH